MGYRQSDLQPAFDGAGTHPFRIWCYGTTDPLDEVLGPGYMRSGGSILRPGELIYVRSCPRREAASGREVDARRSGATTGGRPWEPAVRMALLMVVGWERNAMRLRLVQDFGRPEDAALPVRASEARPAAPTPTLAPPALPQAPAESPALAATVPAVAAPALPQAPAEPPAPAAAAPARRGRGRPPGSRTKKAAFPSFRAGFR
jgi:hypothetical protein